MKPAIEIITAAALDAMKPAADILDAIEHALQRRAEQIKTVTAATQAAEAAAAQRAAAALAHNLETDPAKVKTARAKLDRASEAERVTAAEVDEALRMLAALEAHITAKEAELESEAVIARDTFNSASQQLCEAVAADIEQAAAPLIAALRRAAVLAAAVHSAPLSIGLDEVMIPDPSRAFAPFVGGRRVTTGGTVTDIAAGWQSDSGLVDLAEAARKPRELLARVKGYRTLSDREKAEKPAAWKGYTLQGGASSSGRHSVI